MGGSKNQRQHRRGEWVAAVASEARFGFVAGFFGTQGSGGALSVEKATPGHDPFAKIAA
jgi:hypothetical protein